MATSSQQHITVVIPQDSEAWSQLAQRLEATKGDVLLLLSGHEDALIAEPETRKTFLAACKKMHQRLRIATKHPAIAAEARTAGIRVLDRTKHVKALLLHHPKLNDALRIFSPHLWRQQLKSRMQRMGLLSVPKIRIFALAALSAILFYIVVFRLLPSADVYVKPRQEAVSQTINIFLVQSGATVDLSERVRHMPLIPIVIRTKKSLNFEHISKQFIGSSALMDITVINKSGELYSLRTGTRFSNQAGMIFRITEPAIVDPSDEVTVHATAEDIDLYGQIIGDRGNLPAGIKWDIPGLSEEERALVYGENREPSRGGTTAYRTVLQEEDLELAKKRLEQELLNTAKAMAREMIDDRAQLDDAGHLAMLDYDVLTNTTFSGFVLPFHLLGQELESIPVEGGISYTRLAYASGAVLDLLISELASHTRDGRRLITNNLKTENLDVSVIEYDDNLSWVKITVDLTGTEEYILDPLSPTGAVFAKNARELIAGVHRDEALRILRNMPEVERVTVRQWPPWSRTLPLIPSHISILAE